MSDAAAKRESVADPTPGHQAMMRRTRLRRVLMEGIDRVKAEKVEWLPPAEGEQTMASGAKKSQYDLRVERATIWPFYRRAVRAVVGGVLGKNLQLGDDVPARFAQHAENIDLRGNNLTVFMQAVLADAVATGEPSWITLDHPEIDRPDGEPATDADLGPDDRPYWMHVDSESLLNPEDFEWVNGRPRWRLVRYRRDVTRRKGKWGVETVQQVRVLEPPGEGSQWVRWSVYEKAGDEWPEEPTRSGTIRPLTEIPFIPLGVGALFQELSELNLSHARKLSDYDTTIHKLRPVIARYGVTAEDKKEGPLVMEAGVIFNFTQKMGEAGMEYVEHTGTSLGHQRQDLQDQVAEMEKLALQPHVSRTGDQSATGRAIDFDEAKTEVQAVALRTKDAIEEGARIHALMLGVGEKAGGTVGVPYLLAARKIDAQMATVVTDALAEAGYGAQDTIDELRRQGVVTEELPDPPGVEELEEEPQPPEPELEPGGEEEEAEPPS